MTCFGSLPQASGFNSPYACPLLDLRRAAPTDGASSPVESKSTPEKEWKEPGKGKLSVICDFARRPLSVVSFPSRGHGPRLQTHEEHQGYCDA